MTSLAGRARLLIAPASHRAFVTRSLNDSGIMVKPADMTVLFKS